MSKSLSVLSFAVALAATLTACGGGGGGSTPAPAPAPAPTPAPPPPSGTVTLTGIAARGAALAGATVNIKCAGGTGTATTSASGAYSVELPNASLPCAFEVTATDGTVLHSLRAGTESSGSFNVNITPLTELVVASAAGTAPASFFSAYAAASAPSAAAVTQAIDTVRAATADIVDLTGVNPISDTLVAASGGTVGNTLDQKIDALAAALTAAQTTLAQLSTALVANPTSSAAAATILQPVASGCAWLRSGKYRMINPSEADPLWRAHVLNLDVATLKATMFDGSVVDLTDAGGCKYTADDPQETTTIVVSSAGVLLVQSQSKANAADISLTVGLPEQSLPLANFAGTWNIADWFSNSGAAGNDFVAETSEVTIDANGQITAILICDGLSPCVAEAAPHPTLTVNEASGGFDFVAGGVIEGRTFLFRTPAGKPMFVAALAGGEFVVGTPKQSLGSLPAVGTVSSYRELGLRGSGVVEPLVDNSNTVTAVDAGAKSVTRIRVSDNRVDVLGYDQPRNGLRYRAQNSCTLNGAPLNCAQAVQMPLQGMGITLTLSAGSNNVAPNSFFYISVGKPAN